jgi:hypothetical protein
MNPGSASSAIQVTLPMMDLEKTARSSVRFFRFLDLALQLAGFFLVSPLAVPQPSHFTHDIFSGTCEAKNSKNDHGHAPDINDTHFSVPRANQPYLQSRCSRRPR